MFRFNSIVGGDILHVLGMENDELIYFFKSSKILLFLDLVIQIFSWTCIMLVCLF